MAKGHKTRWHVVSLFILHSHGNLHSDPRLTSLQRRWWDYFQQCQLYLHPTTILQMICVLSKPDANYESRSNTNFAKISGLHLDKEKSKLYINRSWPNKEELTKDFKISLEDSPLLIEVRHSKLVFLWKVGTSYKCDIKLSILLVSSLSDLNQDHFEDWTNDV